MPGSWEVDMNAGSTFLPEIRMLLSQFEDKGDHLQIALEKLDQFCPNWVSIAPTPALIVVSEATGNRVRFELKQKYYPGSHMPLTAVWVYTMITTMVTPCRVSEIFVYAPKSPLAYGKKIKDSEWEPR